MSVRLRPVPATRPRAVLYLRQSISRDDSVSIELQRIAGEDYCARMGYDVTAIEVDEGKTGRNWSKRPAVQRVLDMIERRDADVIVLWKWSRLSRNRRDWAVAVDKVDIAGGRIESATEPIDTATAAGKYARGMMTEHAAFQSDMIGEQWNEVHAHRFRRGLPPTGKLPWGWESHRDHISISDGNAQIIRQMYQLYFEGRGRVYIAGWLNRRGIPAPRGGEWRGITVQSCLDSPIHAGKVTYRGEVGEGAHDGVISDIEYARYQRLREDRHIPRRPRINNYLLSSLIACHCGLKRTGSLTRSRWANGRKSYSSYLCPSSSPHPAKSVVTWKADLAVVQWVKDLDREVEADASALPDIDVEKLARDVIEVDKRLDALTGHLAAGLVPPDSYARTRDTLLEEKAAREAALREAERDRVLSPKTYLDAVAARIEHWDTLQIDDKKAVVRSLVSLVTINEDGETLDLLPQWSRAPITLRLATAAVS